MKLKKPPTPKLARIGSVQEAQKLVKKTNIDPITPLFDTKALFLLENSTMLTTVAAIANDSSKFVIKLVGVT
jgi:hypothetical protein